MDHPDHFKSNNKNSENIPKSNIKRIEQSRTKYSL